VPLAWLIFLIAKLMQHAGKKKKKRRRWGLGKKKANSTFYPAATYNDLRACLKCKCEVGLKLSKVRNEWGAFIKLSDSLCLGSTYLIINSSSHGVITVTPDEIQGPLTDLCTLLPWLKTNLTKSLESITIMSSCQLFGIPHWRLRRLVYFQLC